MHEAAHAASRRNTGSGVLTEGLGAAAGQPGLQGEVQMSSMPQNEPQVSAFAGR